MKTLRLLVIGWALIVGVHAQATEVGVGLGVKSAATHRQYPIQTKAAVQTNVGFQVKDTFLSTDMSGSVDLVGHIAYDSKEEAGQGIIASNLLQRTFQEVSIEARSILQVTDNNGAGRMGADNLSTSIQIAREILPTVEGRIIGGGYYSHQDPYALLVGAGLSKELLSCKFEIDLWKKECLTITSRVSKEVEFHKFTLGAMTDTVNSRNSRVWFEISVSIDNLSDL